MKIEETKEVPNRKSGRKIKIKELSQMEVGNRICVDDYTVNNMNKYGSIIYYFNKVNAPKKMVQRKIEDKIFIYREK